MFKTTKRIPIGRVSGLLATLSLLAAPAVADETYVVDPMAGNGSGALFRVDAANGNRTLVSDFGNAAQGPLGVNPLGIALEAAGTVLIIDLGTGTIVIPRDAADTVLVSDPDAGTAVNGALFRVDAASGVRSLVSDFADADQGPPGNLPFGLAVEAAGTLLVAAARAGTDHRGALFRVDRLSGRRTLVSDFGNVGQGALGANPGSVAVVVPPCQGRVPTVVGDNGNNVLIASPGNDVILGRGGADLVDGRGGNDLICGGDGNDALRGGSGNDEIEGGAGADTLEGGPGDDRLDGGTNTDRCQNAEVKLGCEL